MLRNSKVTKLLAPCVIFSSVSFLMNDSNDSVVNRRRSVDMNRLLKRFWDNVFFGKKERVCVCY